MKILQVLHELNVGGVETGTVDQLLHKRPRKHPRCPLLILTGQNNVPEAVGGILELSDIHVVSGDSILMVPGAAS